ncbi:MAG: tetratricopeptide repeat protein, partial [Candidatus Latescibacterota bacterium]
MSSPGMFATRLVVLVCALIVLIPSQSQAQTDPVTTFIIEADSAAAAGGDESLTTYITDHSILVGAAIGQLLDVAFEIGQAGETAAEEENVAFAERVARLFRSSGGSPVPLELVEIYKSWSSEQRTERANLKALEAQAFETRDAGEFDQAAEMFNRVIEMCGAIDDRRTIAVTWGSLGVIHWYRGDLDSVEASYNRALEARRAIEDRILEGKTLNGLGSVNYRKGDYEKAIDYYTQAADLRRQTGDLGGLGISLTYKGNAYYHLNRLVDARETFEEAYAILEKGGSPAQLIEILNSTANIYTEMGSLQRANECYLRAIDIAATVDQPQDEASCRMNLADNYKLQGRYKEALSQFDAAKPLLERQPEPAKTAFFYGARGSVYLEMGEFDHARDDLLQYVELAEQLEDQSHHIEALVALGYLYLELDAYEQARAVAEKLRPLAEGTGNGRLMRSAYVLSSTAEQRLGNFEEALVQRRLALDIDRQQESVLGIVEDEMSIASLYAVLGENERARELCYANLGTVREWGRKELELVVHFGIAHSFEKENPDSAVWHYERGLALLEETREAVGGSEIRTGFLAGERRFLYEEVARYYSSLGGQSGEGLWYDRAFVTMERAKARGLLDLLERPALMDMTSAEESLLDSLYRIEADTPAQQEKKRRLEERYLAMRNQRVDESVGTLSPGGEVAGLEAVQNALPKKTALFEYALGDTVSLLWVVDRKGYDFYELPNRKMLAPQIQRLRDAIGQPERGGAVLRKTARDLYVTLIAPAEDRLGKIETVVIVPDGALFELPFEVLMTDEPGDDAGWGELPYLARLYNTVYAPSASVFTRLKQSKKRKYDFDVLAIGDPDFDSASDLDPLPYTRTEIENI